MQHAQKGIRIINKKKGIRNLPVYYVINSTSSSASVYSSSLLGIIFSYFVPLLLLNTSVVRKEKIYVMIPHENLNS